MATNQQEAAADAGGQQGGGVFKSIFNGIIRLMVMYTISRFLFGTKQSTKPQTAVQQTVDPQTGQVISIPAPVLESVVLHNLFPRTSILTMHAFLSNSSEFAYRDDQAPFWVEKHMPFAQDPSSHRIFDQNLTRSTPQYEQAFDALVRNESYYLHMFFTREGVNYNPSHPTYKEYGVHHVVKQLNKYMKEKKNKKKNLLAKPSEAEIESAATTSNATDDEPTVYKSYWNPEITVSMVDFHEQLSSGSLPPHMSEYIKIRQTKKRATYDPIIYVNDFWVIRDNMLILNDTLERIPLRIEITPTSAIKWQLYVQMQASLDMQKSFGAMGDGEGDQMKKLFLETNPYLLAVTILVSLVHSVLDFLAFKNDITFWKNKENVEGLSVKSMFVNFFFQVVIFLYLLDNDTSWLILGSSFVGLLIEAWKMKKAVNFKIQTSFPFITYEDKTSYTQSKTKEYDDEAMRYVSYVLYPLIVLYAIYSLFYESHKGWYSWILGTAVGFIYMFGFIMMTPQLFINYKLKSVAHLNLKTFAYKAVNTFIDDLFSFVIKMPTLHRIACFRDDIIFFIYLYQRWIYPVDKTRVNEFGQCEEPTDQLVPVNTTTETAASEETTTTTTPITQQEEEQKEEEEFTAEDETSTLRKRKDKQQEDEIPETTNSNNSEQKKKKKSKKTD